MDTDRDPYSIKKGFFYAHIGWLLFWKHPEHYENSKDLLKNPLVMHQHKHYHFWAAGTGILLPVGIGFLYGDPLGALIFAVCMRFALVHHATFAINSICHTFGKSTYDIYSTAKDHWLVALITNGEGYHNFHHHFPSDYRNGVRWYQWDPTKWFIAVLGKLRIVRDLKRVSAFRIMAAKFAAENQRAEDSIRNQSLPSLVAIQSALKTQYERLKLSLSEWENSARDYQAMLQGHLERQSQKIREAAMKKLEARQKFLETLGQWKSICVKLKALSSAL